MNPTVKNVMIFVAGAGSGGAIAALATKEYFRKKYAEIADAEIADMEDYYHRRVEEIVNYFPEDEEVNPVDEDYNGISEEEAEGMTSDPDSIKEKLTRNYEQTTNYAKMYKGGKNKPARGELTEEEKEQLNAESESPTEDDSMEAQAERATEEHAANMDRPPKLISEDALGELPGYIEHKVLFFYKLDDILTDEEDNVIDDPDYLLGDCLDKYNFRESEETIIFVRNFALDTVYEVQKVDAAFDDGE